MERVHASVPCVARVCDVTRNAEECFRDAPCLLHICVAHDANSISGVLWARLWSPAAQLVFSHRPHVIFSSPWQIPCARFCLGFQRAKFLSPERVDV